MFKAGFSKKDMTCFIPGIGMMGYGQDFNRVKSIATKLWSRVGVIFDGHNYVVHACLEQCLISQAMYLEIIKRTQKLFPQLNLKAENFLINAQHTHSAPGGYTHFAFYNISIPNFRPKVFNTVVQATVDAIKESIEQLKDVEIEYAEYTIPEDVPIAFNRSLEAYKRNKNISQDLKNFQAVDRTMRAFLFYHQSKLIGMFNYFGVHCTSVSNRNTKIHHDNKGVAADLFEKYYDGSISLFMQETAGDVSPNWIFDKKLNWMRGQNVDEYKNAEQNGIMQFEAAKKIVEGAKVKVIGDIKNYSGNYDVTKIATAPAHGVAFFLGTAEGPGMPSWLGGILKKVSAVVKLLKLSFNFREHAEFYNKQGAKAVMLDHRTGEFLGISTKVWKWMPFFPDPLVMKFLRNLKSGSLKTLPWVPYILPLQAFKLGQFLILGVPGEITTHSGHLLREKMYEITKTWGIEKIIISSYTNSFMGYITTKPEYQLQCYEAGHTIYGENTLESFIHGHELLLKGQLPEIQLQQYPEKELLLRTIEDV